MFAKMHKPLLEVLKEVQVVISTGGKTLQLILEWAEKICSRLQEAEVYY